MLLCSIVMMGLVAGCSEDLGEPVGGAGDDTATPITGLDYLTHDNAEDLVETTVGFKNPVPGIPERFDRNRVVDDSFFNASNAVTAAQVQAFLERNPYGTRTFLADTRINGVQASEAIVTASRAHGINPIMMIARMQVEKSLISKTRRPSSSSVDYAFGCGCPDGRACNARFRGLDKQIECAANTLRRRYDESVQGNGIWNRGVGKRSLDPLRIVPATHATASLYAYTPWVLEGRGGNWLVWNITLRFARHFASLGDVNIDDDGGDDDVGASLWVGDLCSPEADDPCSYSNAGTEGHCQPLSAEQGVCSIACEGLCPDRSGRTSTFCVDGSLFGAVGGGVCTVYATSANNDCAALGMVARSTRRYVGGSGSRNRTARVCVPSEPPALAPPVEEPPAEDPPAEEPPMEEPPMEEPLNPCDPSAPAQGTCNGEVVSRCVNGAPVTLDCGAMRQTCEIGPSGAACLPGKVSASESDPRCGDTLTFEGACDGDVALWCSRGDVYAVDCRWYGRGCGFGNDGNGYWCR
ncbi:MAG: hypothetical protein ACE366_22285 [Bradymonadia bacterium]